MDEVFDQQLKRLQTDRIDYYLLHALNKKSWKKMNMLGVTDFLTKAKENGKIRYAGFSFHDDYGTFNRIIHAYDWEFCQIMLNFLDTTYQAGLRGMRLAASRGIGVISMEPLRGGKLVSSIPNDVIDIWRNDPANLDPVKRALRWVWNNPECTLLISGMSTMEHVLQNTQEASVATANSLVPSQLRKYQMARKVYLRKLPFLCSECRYCMPCPNEVSIPTVLGMFCEAVMFGDKERHQREYQSFIPEANRADKCTGCNICTEKCPKKINIPHWMKEISHFYT
jgi:predicted aldo/keto reductase-like oxidoreductase